LISSYGESKFKIGESDSGRKLKVTLRQYVEYLLYNRDDSPLYLFESSLEDHPQAKHMMQDYTPPKFFQQNYFTVVRILSTQLIIVERVSNAAAQVVSDWP
jgi:histone arginine demethylase JMJD6